MSDQRLSNRPRNRILASLTDEDLALLEPHLEPVTLKFRQRLENAGKKIKSAYFPSRGIASVVAISTTERRQAEVALVGREGMTGLAIVLDADRSPNETFMQIPGDGQCIAAADLQRLLETSPTLRACLLRYAHVFSIQGMHSALANSHGKLEERLARWLLMAHDRINGDDLAMTHDFLALMLGVRRAGVTIALHHLEARGLIAMSRRSIGVLDRDGLEESANGLYGAPEAEFERLFPPPRRRTLAYQVPDIYCVTARRRLTHRPPKPGRGRLRDHGDMLLPVEKGESPMPDSKLPNVLRNRILGNMSVADLALVRRHLEPVTLSFRQRLESSNRKIKKVYFAESGLMSVVAVGNGVRAEVGVIGWEGMSGLAVVLGADRSPNETFMQAEGQGQCIDADDLREVMQQSASLARWLLRYAHVFAIQSGHTALANAHGKIEERLARWLLMAQDRLDSDELVLTHEFLSLMLGVRRAGVTIALQQLESQGLVGTARGSVTILDRDGLQEAANGLYGVPEAEFERLFPT
jgi:CRP-like cAMP-binding protein